MAASIYRSAAVSTATYGTPTVAGLIVKSLNVSDSASLTEVKDDQGSVVAVAVGEPVQDISIEGLKTGSFTETVGGALTLTIPGIASGGTTIITKIDTKFAAEQFESFSLTAKHYPVTMAE
jgi:hypothetical protein